MTSDAHWTVKELLDAARDSLPAFREDVLTALELGPRVAARWHITSAPQLLPDTTFEMSVAARIDWTAGDRQFYCVYRDDLEVRAAVSFALGTSAEDPTSITTLALAHEPFNPQRVDPLALEAAVLLVNRLHALSPPGRKDLWLEHSDAPPRNVLIALGFQPVGSSDGRFAYSRDASLYVPGLPAQTAGLFRKWRAKMSRPV
jgi:hypothetical protein